MRAGTPDTDAGLAQVMRRAVRDGIPTHRDPRSDDVEEDLALRRGGPCIPEVVKQRLPDDRRQGIGRAMPGLALGNEQPFTFPIDVIKGQRGDFPGAQPVGHEQKQDRVVTLADRTTAIDALQHHPRLELRRGSQPHPHRARSREHDPAAALRYRSHQGARARRRPDHAQSGQEPAPRPRLPENDRQRRPAASASSPTLGTRGASGHAQMTP